MEAAFLTFVVSLTFYYLFGNSQVKVESFDAFVLCHAISRWRRKTSNEIRRGQLQSVFFRKATRGIKFQNIIL